MRSSSVFHCIPLIGWGCCDRSALTSDVWSTTLDSWSEHPTPVIVEILMSLLEWHFYEDPIPSTLLMSTIFLISKCGHERLKNLFPLAGFFFTEKDLFQVRNFFTKLVSCWSGLEIGSVLLLRTRVPMICCVDESLATEFFFPCLHFHNLLPHTNIWKTMQFKYLLSFGSHLATFR